MTVVCVVPAAMASTPVVAAPGVKPGAKSGLAAVFCALVPVLACAAMPTRYGTSTSSPSAAPVSVTVNDAVAPSATGPAAPSSVTTASSLSRIIVTARWSAVRGARVAKPVRAPVSTPGAPAAGSSTMTVSGRSNSSSSCNSSVMAVRVAPMANTAVVVVADGSVTSRAGSSAAPAAAVPVIITGNSMRSSDGRLSVIS